MTTIRTKKKAKTTIVAVLATHTTGKALAYGTKSASRNRGMQVHCNARNSGK